MILVTVMTEVQNAPMDSTSHPQTTSERTAGPQMSRPPPIGMPAQPTVARIRSGHLNLDTFSPVNQNGSFAFDRVLKSGYVQKRTRKTKVIRQFLNALETDLITRPIGLETHLSRTTTKPSFRIQRSE